MFAYALAALYRQLALLSHAGISPAESFSLMAKQSSGANKRCFEALVQHVWKGQRLSQAMAAYPRLFPEAHRALVSEGETTGRLDATLNRLAEMTEHSLELRRAFRRELWPPTMTLIVAIPFLFFLPFIAPIPLVIFAWLMVGAFGFILAI